MLLKTYEAFEDRLDYTKGADGSWTAEFRGPFAVHVKEPTLERCRRSAMAALDEQLAALITGPTARPVLGTSRRSQASNKAKQAIAKNR